MASISALTSTSANAIAIGPNGATNPVLKINANTASAATGLEVVGAAAAGGLAIKAISSGTNENLTIDAKGSGTISLNATGTGAITLARATGVTGALTGTSTSASALAVGANGATNPVLKVDANTASVATGLNVKGAAAAGGLALAVLSSGTDENLTVDGKGAGTVTINGTATGAITLARATTVTGALGVTGAETVTSTSASALTVGANGATNPVLKVNANTASAATGLHVTGAAAAGGLALAVISSGTNENLTLDAKGSGTITLGSVSTGNIAVSRALVGALGITSTGPTAGIGYATGAGGAVTQATSRTTGVTVNTIAGAITTNTTSLAAAASASFTVTNSAVAATDVVILSIKSGQTNKETTASVSAVAAGSFEITLHNQHGSTAETGASIINFAVIKAVAA